MSKNIIENFSIFCLVPAFNETGNLTELTERLNKVLNSAKIRFKIFFVIQGEKENLTTATLLKKRYPKLEFIYYHQALGIGKAYKIGFRHIDKSYSHVLTLDADLNHQPEELPKFLKVFNKSKSDIIIGSRFVYGGEFKDKRYWKRISSHLTNFFITKLLKIKIHDITSGYRLIKREVVEKISGNLKENNYPSYMEFVLAAIKEGFNIEEIPISYVPRKWGKSKMGKLKTFLDYLFFLSKVFLVFKNPN